MENDLAEKRYQSDLRWEPMPILGHVLEDSFSDGISVYLRTQFIENVEKCSDLHLVILPDSINNIHKDSDQFQVVRSGRSHLRI